jgi:hypothetical protein
VFFIVSFFFLYIFIIHVFLTSSSLFSYPYSYPPRFPFSCTTIHCSPSQLLFLPLLMHYFPRLYHPLLSSHNLPSHYPSLLHTHHWLPYCTNCTQPQSPAIRNTITFHYKEYTQTHTRTT